MAKYCRRCGHVLLPDSLFCEKCGTLVKKSSKSTKSMTKEGQMFLASTVCYRCGSELLSSDLFCKKCGTRVKKPPQQDKVSKPQKLTAALPKAAVEENLQLVVEEPKSMTGDHLEVMVEELTKPVVEVSKSEVESPNITTEESEFEVEELTKSEEEKLDSIAEEPPKLKMEESKPVRGETQNNDENEQSKSVNEEAKLVIEEPRLTTSEPIQSVVAKPKKQIVSKYCHKCGKELILRSSFCRKCGTPVRKAPQQQLVSKTPKSTMEKTVNVVVEVQTKYCYRCGKEVSPNTSFCKNCGAPVRKSFQSNETHRSPNSTNERGRRQQKKTHASSSLFS